MAELCAFSVKMATLLPGSIGRVIPNKSVGYWPPPMLCRCGSTPESLWGLDSCRLETTAATRASGMGDPP